MRAYEAVVLLSPLLEEDGIAEQTEKLREAIERLGGTVASVERWGRRKLSFDIKDHKEGFYLLVRFSAQERGGLTELEHYCRISAHVLRLGISLAVPEAPPRARPEVRSVERGEVATGARAARA